MKRKLNGCGKVLLDGYLILTTILTTKPCVKMSFYDPFCITKPGEMAQEKPLELLILKGSVYVAQIGLEPMTLRV